MGERKFLGDDISCIHLEENTEGKGFAAFMNGEANKLSLMLLEAIVQLLIQEDDAKDAAARLDTLYRRTYNKVLEEKPEYESVWKANTYMGLVLTADEIIKDALEDEEDEDYDD